MVKNYGKYFSRRLNHIKQNPIRVEWGSAPTLREICSVFFFYILTRAGPGYICNTAGRGAVLRPPLTRLLSVVETIGKRHSKDHQKPLRKYFGHFFSQVKNEVTRGHRMKNVSMFCNFDILPLRPPYLENQKS